jgi:hypothetical protein
MAEREIEHDEGGGRGYGSRAGTLPSYAFKIDRRIIIHNFGMLRSMCGKDAVSKITGPSPDTWPITRNSGILA